MSDGVYLDGFSIGGYRSFGPPVLFAPMDQLTFLVGPNNSGKSSVVTFLASTLRPALSSVGHKANKIQFGNLDLFQGATEQDESCPFEFGVAMTIDRYAEFLARDGGPALDSVPTDVIDLISPEQYQDDLVWLVYRMAKAGRIVSVLPSSAEDDTSVDLSADYSTGFWRSLEQSYPKVATTLEDFLRHQILSTVPPVKFVPTTRGLDLRAGSPGIAGLPESLRTDAVSAGGGGLRGRLSSLANPPHAKLTNEERFDEISRFVASLLGNQSPPTVRVPNSSNEPVILDFGNPMPITSQGKGSEDALVIAAMCLEAHRSIICIEEPEAHLHPALQRALIEGLQRETSHQYLLTTHSAHILGGADGSIFSLEGSARGSSAHAVETRKQQSQLVRSLGYRASDLVQAQCVVWVEGASDVVYIREWIRMKAPGLREGLDYAFAQYGGTGNLIHHSAETEGSVQMLAINRKTAFVVDSDRRDAADTLEPATARIVEELENEDIHVWVTAGRQIESHVRVADEPQDPFLDWIPLEPFAKVPFRKKIRRAEAAVAHGLSFTDALDLESRVEELVEFIRQP